MSRTVISNDGSYKVVVGYDPPLGEYFGHIYDVDEEVVVDAASKNPHDVIVGLSDWLSKEEKVQAYNAMIVGREFHDGWKPGPLQKALGFTGLQK